VIDSTISIFLGRNTVVSSNFHGHYVAESTDIVFLSPLYVVFMVGIKFLRALFKFVMIPDIFGWLIMMGQSDSNRISISKIERTFSLLRTHRFIFFSFINKIIFHFRSDGISRIIKFVLCLCLNWIKEILYSLCSCVVKGDYRITNKHL
jgi:hypothetical protein